jgi:hypothetical protein
MGPRRLLERQVSEVTGGDTSAGNGNLLEISERRSLREMRPRTTNVPAAPTLTTSKHLND